MRLSAAAQWCGALPILAFLVGSGCRRENQPPVISSIEGDTAVAANYSGEYHCSAWDWELRDITFKWSATMGSLVPDTLSTVMWHSPESSGAAMLLVEVTDDSGLVTSGILAVRVYRDTSTAVDYRGAVKSASYRRWTDVYLRGGVLVGEFEVDTSLVSFLVLDDSSFGRWLGGEPYVPLLERSSVPDDTFTVEIPEYGTYHMVLDNRQGKMDLAFWIRVRWISP